MSKKIDSIILGSGPAGLTAALYIGRGGKYPLIFEGGQPGGQLTTTTEIENFSGFPQSIMGSELMSRMRDQAARFGTEFKGETVRRLDLSSNITVFTDEGEYQAKTLVIATGANPRKLGVAGEEKLVGRGISYCATCDGFFFRGRNIAVVGGGDSAAEEADFLTRFADQVTLIHRRDALRASKVVQDRIFANPKIKLAWNSTVDGLESSPEGALSGLKLKSTTDGSIVHLPVEGLFVAIGHNPNTSFLKGQVKLNEQGYIVVENGYSTSVKGVFACGDVMDKKYRQAIVAAGSGAAAGIEALTFLTE